MNSRRFRVLPRRWHRFLGFASSLALGSTLFLSASAAPAQAQESNFTPAPLFSRSDITFRTLPNGVRTVIKQAPGPDQVCVQVWVRAGSRFERNGENGAAHLVELAALRGSKNYPASDDSEPGGLQGELSTVGGDAGALTSRDSTFYSATVAKPYWGRALRALADAVINPNLSDDDIDEARAVAYGDLTGRLVDPITNASDLAYITAFGKHPYRHAPIGTQQTLGALTSAKVRSYHQRHYVGKNISVVIVGDVTPSSAMEAVRRTFGAASSAAPPVLQLPAEPAAAAKQVTRRAPTVVGATALAWRSPNIKATSDVLALDTLLALWREGLDANLRRLLLRDGTDGPQKPLVAAYDVDFLTQRDPGLFIINFSGYNDPAEAMEVILNEVKRVQTEGISEAELTRAKKQLRQQYIDQSSNVAGQAGAFGFYEMIDTYEFAVNYLDLASQVTAADMQRVAKQYLTPERLVRAEIQSLQLPKPREEDPLNNDVIEVRNPTRSRWAKHSTEVLAQ